MKLAIIGTGYVGLVTSAVFADFGNQVVGVDIDAQKIKTLKSGQTPFYEPGLSDLLIRNQKTGRLEFTTDYAKAIPDADVIFICVGTPSDNQGRANLEYVFAAARSLAPLLKNNAVVVIKSTVPPGTHLKVKQIIDKVSKNHYFLASTPEFLREGSAIEDTLHPDRVVIGADDRFARETLLDLHRPINGKRILTDIISAQLIKYAANAFLASKISFANEVARLCDAYSADVMRVMEGIGEDKRIGKAFLHPGIGYGGSCFPKDVKAVLAFGREKQVNLNVIKGAHLTNQTQVDYLINKIKATIGSLKKVRVGVLGLAFKGNTDDIRESRALILIEKLIAEKALVHAYDPMAADNVKKFYPNLDINYHPSWQEVANQSQILIIATDWNEFKELDLKQLSRISKIRYIFDGRNILNPDKVKQAGFEYVGIGR
ncbi:MAG: UDP-glucose/GDP-mannose dehydrogenase family protein [bacterium]|nr:UDP-glucose/GDP-mannose dehydrogenase family protein [bacterium]